MKKQINMISVIFILMILFRQSSVAQVDVTNHTAVSGFYVGWGVGSGFDLDIKTLTSGYNINFLTNGGSGATQRMIIKNSGEVGIGLTTTAS